MAPLAVKPLLTCGFLGVLLIFRFSLKTKGPSVGKQAQKIPTHNSPTDQPVASTLVNVSSVARLKAGRYWILTMEIATPLFENKGQ